MATTQTMDDFHGWLSWTVEDNCHGWLSWMTFMDDCHGWLSWMTLSHSQVSRSLDLEIDSIIGRSHQHHPTPPPPPGNFSGSNNTVISSWSRWQTWWIVQRDLLKCYQTLKSQNDLEIINSMPPAPKKLWKQRNLFFVNHQLWSIMINWSPDYNMSLFFGLKPNQTLKFLWVDPLLSRSQMTSHT